MSQVPERTVWHSDNGGRTWKPMIVKHGTMLFHTLTPGEVYDDGCGNIYRDDPPDDVMTASPESTHMLVWDPPAGLTAARRWTCKVCGAAKIDYGGNVYGSAVEKTCDEYKAQMIALDERLGWTR